MTRAAIYMRVSSAQQVREGDSIPAQREALLEYVRKHGMVLAGEYLDDGVSGTRSDRDELTRLLGDVEAGKVDVILITRLDRLYRSIRHYLNMMDVLDRHHVGWTAIWEPIYDTTTPQGRLIVNQMMSIAQFEAENTGQRVKAVLAYKAQQHEVITGNCPPGYRIQNKRLVPGKGREAVRKAFDVFLSTSSINAVLRACSGLGLPRTHDAMKRLLRNRTYIGERHGIPGYCEPIIDLDTFEAAQRLLTVNVRSSQKHTYIFSGLIRCGVCGRVMAGNRRKRVRGASTSITMQYRCAKHYNTKPPACPNAKVIYEHLLEEELMSRIRPEIEGIILDYDIKSAEQLDPSNQIKSIERKLSRLKDLYVEELISLEEYKHDKQDLTQQLEDLRKPPAPEHDLDALKALLETDIEEMYWDMTPAEKRIFWRSIIREIRFGQDRSVEVDFL